MQAEAEAFGRVVGRLIGLCGFPTLIVLIVGSLRYLTKRPRISFAQAFLPWWLILIGAIIFVFAAVGLFISKKF